MLAGLVIVFALVAAGTGYAVFFGSAHRGIGFWDVAFVAAAVVFLVFFVRLIVALAETTVRSSAVGRRAAGMSGNDPMAKK